jgi:hypothetical protein
MSDFKIQQGEHPKSAICRYISQFCTNPDSVKISIDNVEYEHTFQQDCNKNIFVALVTYTINSQTYLIKSSKWLTKKEAEKEAYDNIYNKLIVLVKKHSLNEREERNNISYIKTKNSSNGVVKDSNENLKSPLEPNIKCNSNLTLKSSSEITSKLSSKSISNDKDSDSDNKSLNVFDVNSLNASEKNISDNDNNSDGEDEYYDITHENSNNNDSDLSNTIVVIVDFENVSNKNDIIKLTQFVKTTKKNKTKHDIKMVKIAGYCSTVKSTADIVVRSNRKDAVDHYISYYIGLLEAQPKPPMKIYIISRDKFGSCLQDFCNNVEHNSDVSDFINVFNSS